MFRTQETKSIYQSFTNVLDATKQVVARCIQGSTHTDDACCALMVMFGSLIIHTFQLVFLDGTMFFSHNKLAGTVFRLVFSAKRTGPMSEFPSDLAKEKKPRG